MCIRDSAGSIQLDDIHEAAFVGLHAVDTGIAGVAVLEVQAVDCFGDNPGRGGLSSSTVYAEKV